MNSTSLASRLVSSAARSRGFSSTGPLVWRRFTPSSCAMMCESVVLPRPGGPNSKTWSSASLRFLAAPMKISSCSRTFTWPTYSSSSLGRSARSIASSLGDAGAADTTRGAGAKSSVWMLMGCSLRQRLQRQFDALAYAHIGRQGLEGGGGVFFAVAQRHQGLLDVALHIALHRASAGQVQVGAELALEFEQQAFGGLLADAGHLDDASAVLRADGLGQIGHAHARQHRQRRARPHAADLDELAKGLAFGRAAKAVQDLRVLAHHEVRQQRHFFARARQVVESAHGHVHLVAHAVAVDQDLRRILFQQGAGQLAYHWELSFVSRSPGCPRNDCAPSGDLARPGWGAINFTDYRFDSQTHLLPARQPAHGPFVRTDGQPHSQHRGSVAGQGGAPLRTIPRRGPQGQGQPGDGDAAGAVRDGEEADSRRNGAA